MKKIQNGRDIHPQMNEKQNGYQKRKFHLFLVCRTEMRNFCYLHKLGTETLMSDVYLSSPDIDCIAKSKMAVILHIYHYNSKY